MHGAGRAASSGAPPTHPRATWWAGEVAALRVAHPRLHHVLRAVWRHPGRTLVPVAAVVVGVLGTATPDGDAGWFRRAGLSMIGPGFWDVFADPGLQVGALLLLPVGLVAAAARALSLPELFAVAASQAAFVTWFALVTTRRATAVTGAAHLPAQWAVGTVLALGGLLADAVASGHPEEILVALLLVHAACAALASRGVVAGALVGVAAGLKLWGLLGFPVGLLGRSRRVLVTVAVVAAGVVVACYLPFVALGEVRTFEFEWALAQRPGLRVLVGPGPSDWTLRLLQGACCVLTGALVALRRHGSPVTVVLCVVATRLLLDPLLFGYYLGPLVTVALIWAWSRRGAGTTRLALAATLLVPLHVVVPFLLSVPAVFRLYGVLMVAVPALALALDRRDAARCDRRGEQASDLVPNPTQP